MEGGVKKAVNCDECSGNGVKCAVNSVSVK